jgi:diguanylate cyclase (GGDEF)-like protein
VGLLFIDVDHFKLYNDLNGHPAGDRLLKRLADVLIGGRSSGLPLQARRSDVVARYGGEEFVMVLPQTTLDGAVTKAEHICRIVAAYPFDEAASQPGGCVSVSIGVACFPQAGPDSGCTLIPPGQSQCHWMRSRNRSLIDQPLPRTDHCAM